MKKLMAILLSLTLACAAVLPALAEGKKDETVYVLANPDGSARRVIVSDYLSNPDGADTIADVSNLEKIQNVKGDEAFADGVWQAKGNEIYYQGDSSEALPVELKISATLDGTEIAPADLAGKSGHVTMRFDYENTQYETKTIAGKSQRIYVPFAVLTGAILDSDNFRNVSVTNGKLVDDGDHTVVVGMAFPGLQENLALDTDKLEIPSYVEVSADVTDFSIETTLTVVTNSVFNDVDEDKLDKDALDELSDDLDKLTDAMEQLMDGSDELFDGLDTLLDKSHELADGVGQLSSGLKKLDANSAQLNEGAKTVFNTLLDTANKQLQANESLSEAGITIPELTISNYADVLNGVIAKLDPDSVIAQAEAAARQQVTAAVRAQEDTVRAAVTEQVRQNVSDNVTAAVKASVLEGVLKSQGMTQEQYEVADDTVKIDIGNAVDAKMNTETVQQNISATVSAQMASPEVKALIDQNTEQQISLLIEQNMNSETVRAQIDAATAQASAGAKQLLALRQQLDSYNTFYMGLQTYTAGVAEAAAGAVKLNRNMPDLIDGVKKLRDGSLELADGIKELNEEGIEKLVDAFDGDLTELSDRLQATIDVSRDYRSFIGSGDSGDGVKFIFRTDAIENDA